MYCIWKHIPWKIYPWYETENVVIKFRFEKVHAEIQSEKQQPQQQQWAVGCVEK